MKLRIRTDSPTKDEEGGNHVKKREGQTNPETHTD